MNDAAGPICFITALLIIIFAVIYSLSGSSLNRAALEAVAKRWKGYIEPADLLDDEQVLFPLGDSIARLHFSHAPQAKNARGSRRNTHLTVHFPDPNLRLDLYSAGLIQHLRKLLGMHDIEIGSAAFDEAFVITGNNPDLIREYLTAGAQSAIIELANFSTVFAGNLHLSINGGQLRVTKHTPLNSIGELTRFVALTEIMFQALAYGRNPGIEFVATTPPPVIQDTQCQVCGEALAGNIVSCASCKTPHHLDCWQYFGSCAVYGCGQKRYVSSRPAQK